jgi:hypothetical protein
MKTLVTLAISTLLLGSAAWWFLLRDEVFAAAPSPLDSNVPTALVKAAAAAIDPGAEAPAVDTIGPNHDIAARNDAVDAPTAGRPLPDDAEWITVTIIDKANDAPVPGAEVFWVDTDAWEYLQTLPADSWQHDAQTIWQDHDRLATLAGWRTRSNANGQARIAVAAQSTVYARADGGYGTAFLRRNTIEPDGGHRLFLLPEQAVTVRVVDAAGEPAFGVPVQIVPIDAAGKPQGQYMWQSMAKTKEPDGRATIPHLQVLQQNAAQSLDLGKQPLRWHVRPALCGLEAPGEPIDLAAPPAEPILLRLPACGELHVRAVFRGQPIADFDQAYLYPTWEGNRKFRNYQIQAVGSDGVARFRFMPLGTKVVTYASAGGGLQQEGEGPVHQGQIVELTLAPEDERMLLRGRLVDSERQPLAKQRVSFFLKMTDGQHQTQFMTNADGSFTVAAGHATPDDGVVEECSFSIVRAKSPTLQARASLRAVRPGIEDLGDLVATEPKPLVAGKLVDADGAPFTRRAHAWVEQRSTDEGDDAGPRLLFPGAEHGWEHVNASTFIDPQGNFRVYSETCKFGGQRHRLRVQATTALPIAPVEFAPGRTDLVVTLTAGTLLAASVLLPATAPTEHLRAELLPKQPQPAAAGKPTDPLTASPQAQRDERFDLQWGALAPGSYTLKFSLWTQRKPFLEVTDIQVPPPDGGDPRLRDIDLRPFLRIGTLELLDLEGKPTEPDSSMLVPSGLSSDVEWQGFDIGRSRTKLLLPSGAHDWLLVGGTHRPQPVHFAGEVATVRLEPWPTLEVLIPGVPELAENCFLYVTAPVVNPTKIRVHRQRFRGEEDDLMAPSAYQCQVENGRAQVPIGDGVHRLQLQIQGEDGGYEFANLTPTTVLSSARSVTLQVPAEEWDKAKAVVNPTPKATNGK